MQTPIDISIVTYNSSSWLKTFFDSLYKQHYPLNQLSIFIHDNSSTDETLIECQKLQKLFGYRFARFIVAQGPNQGFGHGHNQNFHKGSSPFFLVANVDLEFERDSLIEIMKMVNNEHDEKIACFEFRQKPYEHPKYYHPVTLETNWCSSACVLFRRSAYKAINGYEEKIFLYGEDVEISYRLRDRGYTLKYCPRAVCWHYTYDNPHELKPLQYFGSKTANIYIRLRYGNILEIINGFIFYLVLFFIPARIDHRCSTLFKNLFTILKNTPYFLATRKKSRERFLFNGFDYGSRRIGAFYTNPNLATLPVLPLISVIIRTYEGRSGWLKEAITSVCNQTYPNIELVVIEDGSASAKEFIETLQQQSILSRIIYQSIKKSGRSVAGNEGLLLATGEFHVFLDDDDLFFADHVEILVSALLKHPEAGASYSIAFEVDTRLLSIEPLRYREYHYCVNANQPFSRALLWYRNYLPIQSVLFKRSLYLEQGGFDTSFDALEDWDLWCRYSSTKDFIFIEKLTSLYRVPANWHKARQRLCYLEKYHDKLKTKQEALLKALDHGKDLQKEIQKIEKQQSVFGITRRTLKNIILRSRFLFSLYQMVSYFPLYHR